MSRHDERRSGRTACASPNPAARRRAVLADTTQCLLVYDTYGTLITRVPIAVEFMAPPSTFDLRPEVVAKGFTPLFATKVSFRVKTLCPGKEKLLVDADIRER